MDRDPDITTQIPLLSEPGTAPGPQCPDAVVLAAYAEGGLAEGDRDAFEEHLADCSFCLGQVGFLVREAERQPPSVPAALLDAVREPRARWLEWFPRPALAGLAAAAALVLGIAVVLQLGGVPGSTGARTRGVEQVEKATSGAGERTVRNGTLPIADLRILQPEEGAVLRGAEVDLRWAPVPQALQYTVQLASLQGDLVWEGRTGEPGVTIPTAGLAAGARYFVWVEAQLRDGGTLKSSPIGFTLAAD